ncbi:MAG: hypothetical protein AAB463_00950 [Patescibacteria group bacterium]
MNNLEKIRGLSWPDVVDTWRSTEENLEHWQKFWSAKGFSSWQAWREKTHANLRGPELSWALYKVSDSLNQVPQWRGGMFHSWAKWFYPMLAEQPPRLRDLLEHPGVHNHWFIRDIAKTFPAATTIMAIRTSNGDIVIVEGMHRCCALALLARDKKSVATELNIVLADWPFGDMPRLGSGWEKP